MTIVKWAAAGVTLLMGLANLGQIAQDVSLALKILGVALALAALVAVVAVLARRRWGAAAVITIGAANLGAAIIGAVAGVDGWPVGLVLAALGIVLGAVYAPTAGSAVTA